MSATGSLLLRVLGQALPRVLPVLRDLLHLLRRELDRLRGRRDAGPGGARRRDLRRSGEPRPAVPAEHVPLPGAGPAVRTEPRGGGSGRGWGGGRRWGRRPG